MKRLLQLALLLMIALALLPADQAAGRLAADAPGGKLLIAFASYRERPKHPNIFFYEHDGKASGKIVGSVATPRAVASAEAHPSLTPDGRLCAFTFELENQTGRIQCWDLKEQQTGRAAGDQRFAQRPDEPVAVGRRQPGRPSPPGTGPAAPARAGTSSSTIGRRRSCSTCRA